MHPLLLGAAAAAAAIAIAPAPAAALDPETLTAASVTVHRNAAPGFIPSAVAPPSLSGVAYEGRRGGDRRLRGPRRGLGGVYVSRYFDHEDRTFEPDSYNDWWHERPHRAFPRWVRDNAQTCDRRWWSGGVWRC